MNSPASNPTPLPEKRATFLVLAGAGCAHLALTAAGLPGWPCPFRNAFGIPCPGCGLTRAIIALLHGDWHRALALHAFAPIAVLALAVITLSALLPTTPRARLTATLARLDARFRLSWLLLAALLIYWLARFSLDGPVFRQLAV